MKPYPLSAHRAARGTQRTVLYDTTHKMLRWVKACPGCSGEGQHKYLSGLFVFPGFGPVYLERHTRGNNAQCLFRLD